jgi:hypothetical protein
MIVLMHFGIGLAPFDRWTSIDDLADVVEAADQLGYVPAGGGRYATQDTEINGVEVRKGEMVFLCWASANLDPATFDQPLEPDIGRGTNPHIAFAGVRAAIHLPVSFIPTS